MKKEEVEKITELAEKAKMIYNDKGLHATLRELQSVKAVAPLEICEAVDRLCDDLKTYNGVYAVSRIEEFIEIVRTHLI